MTDDWLKSGHLIDSRDDFATENEWKWIENKRIQWTVKMAFQTEK